MSKILIAMSGGVDSSLAAKMMTDEGYDCIGCTMKLHEASADDVSGQTCGSERDAEDAAEVAAKLGMPFYVYDFSDSFYELVIKRFIEAYEKGITPNPCIECNRYMKFAKLFECARSLGCDYIATGHYARVEEKDGVFFLKKAVDETKDQSYVLYSLTQEQLKHTLFPLGGMRKTEVREQAEKAGFVNAKKPDSQDICFVPEGDYASVIRHYTGVTYPAGNYIDTRSGKVIGQHKGIIHYTIGQHKHLGIPTDEPLYVCRIDTASNEIYLGRNEDLMSREFTASGFNWISGKVPAGEFRAAAKVRYRHKDQPALIIPEGEDKVRVIFDEPQRAITPGQAAVVYDGDVVLGGGTID